MAKSGVLKVRNDSNSQSKPTSHTQSKETLTESSAEPPPGHVSTEVYTISFLQARAFSDVASRPSRGVNFAGFLDFRSTSPAPSDDCLQSLESLRLNVEANKIGYEDSYNSCSKNSIPVIECKHYLEVQDAKHRYGTYLRPYYDIWMSSASTDPFFTWLDQGEGRNADASTEFTARPHCVPRSKLDQTKVYYCSAKERERYRVVVRGGKLVWANKNAPNGNGKYSLVDTEREDRWIFVIDETGNLYLNKKSKGRFHHSSFVSGRPVRVAGRIIIENGDIVSIGPNSGHYLTPQHQLLRAIDEFFGHPVEDFSPPCARNSFGMDCA